MSLTKEVEFDTGHRVPDHASKCFNPHGHRYRVRATCAGELINEDGAADNGMLVDFSDLKAWMTEYVHDVYDHAFVVYENDDIMRSSLEHGSPDWKIVIVPFIPTAENMAQDIFDRLAPIIESHWRNNIRLVKIEVWETPTSKAIVE